MDAFATVFPTATGTAVTFYPPEIRVRDELVGNGWNVAKLSAEDRPLALKMKAERDKQLRKNKRERRQMTFGAQTVKVPAAWVRNNARPVRPARTTSAVRHVAAVARRSLGVRSGAPRRVVRVAAASGSPGRESGGDDPPAELPPPPVGRLHAATVRLLVGGGSR